MAQEQIREFSGRILGSYEYLSNGDIVCRNFSGVILGTYQKRDNTTRDFHGVIIAYGNVLGKFFYDR